MVKLYQPAESITSQAFRTIAVEGAQGGIIREADRA
jgi:hypothetical protein